VSVLAIHPAVSGHRPAGLSEPISPELDLLLACARREMSETWIEYALGLVDSLNWSVLLERARAHRLFPLLYWHCKTSLRLKFPGDLAERLSGCFRVNMARSLLLAQELAAVIELLDQHGISAVPFKGPALAESLYGNSALRESVDLDILIRRHDVVEAHQILLSAGYVDGKRLPAAQRSAYIRTQYEHPVSSPSGVLVELQWAIVPRYFSLPLDEERYWSGIQPVTFCGRQMNSLSPEDLLLFLCIHGGKHRWERLIWLADVRELVVSNRSLDWDYILDQARRAGALRMLQLGMVLANRLLGIAIPADVEYSFARDPIVTRIAEGVEHDLVSGKLPTYLESQHYLLRVREHWQDRLRYLFRFTSTATPAEWEIISLPPAFSGAYRLVRMVRGLGKAMSLAGKAGSRVIKSKAIGLSRQTKTAAR
jgi:hypothetical protein